MKKYGVIYADPPYKFDNFDYPEAKRGARKEYKTSVLQKICSLDVPSIASDNCALFLWVPWPLMFEYAPEILRKWGFEYKTLGFVWLKKNKIKDSFFWGGGWWTRSNSEICLLAMKGKPKRMSASVHQIIMTKRNDIHSRKPCEAREKIVTLMGDVPRIELFATEKVEGWDSWGDKVKNDIEINWKKVKKNLKRTLYYE